MAQIELQIPAELVEALAADQVAADKFRTLPPSHRKEYVDWIQSAKQEKTRSSRALKAVERLRS